MTGINPTGVLVPDFAPLASRGTSARASRLAVALLLLVASVLIGGIPAAQAAPIVPFQIAFQTNDSGATFTLGNNLLTCPASAANCAAVRAGTRGGNNNGFAMTHLDADSDASTFNSSRSSLELPPDAEVLWAGLYWGARLSRGDGGVAATTSPLSMSFRLPGEAAYRSVTADRSFGPTSGDQAYQQFADVTTLVSEGGAGDYWGANVAAGTGSDRYAGWSVTVVYRSSTQPLRNLTVFDGFTDVGRGNPETVTIDGFLAPFAGAVDARISIVGYEADTTTSGDSVTLRSGSRTTLLGTAITPTNNFFNGTSDVNGVSTTNRLPADVNMLGFDLKRFPIPGTIENGATSAAIDFTSTGDRYFPGMVATSINLYAPDLTTSSKSVVNLAGRSTAQVGDTLEYTVALNNTGQDPTDSTVLTDPLPDGTAYVPGSLAIISGPGAGSLTDAPGDDRGEFDAANQTVRVRAGDGGTSTAGGSLAVGGTTSVRFRVTVLVAAAGTVVRNVAAVEYQARTLGIERSYSPNPVTTDVATRADLVLTKSSTPARVVAGNLVTSTIVVVNNGPTAAANVQVQDQLPAGTTFVSASATSGSCALGSGGSIACAVGLLADGAQSIVTVQYRVPSTSLATSATNLARVTTSTNDPDLTNNAAGSAVAITRSADVSVTKQAPTTPPVPGTVATYSITLANAGPSAARDVSVTDAIDDATLAQLVGISSAGGDCTPTGAAGRCLFDLLDAGQTRTIDVTVAIASDVPEGTPLLNSAVASSATSDPIAANNTDEVTTPAGAPVADVSLSKSASSSVVAAGDRVTYVLDVENLGPSAAADIRVTDALPASASLISVTSDRGTCSATEIDCTLGTLPAPVGGPGGRARVVAVVAIDSDASTGSLSNQASVSTSAQDPLLDNNDAVVTVSIESSADLRIQKASDTPTIIAGQIAPVTYTLTVTNRGPSTARSAEFVDALPSGLTVSSVNATGGTCQGVGETTASCALGDVLVGDVVTITVVASVPADLSDGDILNTATIASATPDPVLANNSASTLSSADTLADLTLLKELDSPLVAGAPSSYTVTYSNEGPGLAQSVVVSDALPSGLTLDGSATAPCVADGGGVTCALGDLAAGASGTLVIPVRPDANLTDGAIVTNTATIASTTKDPVVGNNVDSTSDRVGTVADLLIQKDGLGLNENGEFEFGLQDGPPGSILGFQLSVTNVGPSLASGVTLRDAFEAEAAVGQLESSQGSCDIVQGEIECELGDIPAGQSAFVVIAGATISALEPGTYDNVASVSAVTSDPDPTNNVAVFPVLITDPVADIAVTKTALDGSTVVAGSTVTYEIRVDGLLGSDAQGVTLEDVLPPGLVDVSVSTTQGTCTVAEQLVQCSLGRIPGIIAVVQPLSAVVTVTGRVDTAATGTLTTSATVATTTDEFILANNVADTVQSVVQQADVDITKLADAEQFFVGGIASWTVTATNEGPSNAVDVVIADQLPVGLSLRLEQSDPRCTDDAGLVTCDVGQLAAGSSVSLAIAAEIPTDTDVGEVTNTASVTTSSNDPDPVDTASVTTPLLEAVDLVVTKQASIAEPAIGSAFSYTLTATNAGPSIARDVALVDDLPPGFVVTTVTSNPVGSCVATDSVTCLVDALAVGASLVVTIDVTITDSVEPGLVTNSAQATSGTSELNPADNSASVSVDVQRISDLRIAKETVTTPVVAGLPVTYRLAVTNAGPSTATDVVISDTLPEGTEFVSASDGCTLSAPEGLDIITCELAGLVVGASATVEVTVLVDRGFVGSLTNEASIGSGALDPVTFDNIDRATDGVLPAAELSISKSGPVELQVGGLVEYRLVYENQGGSLASDVVVIDEVPSGLTFIRATNCPAGNQGQQRIECAIGDVAAGEQGVVTMTFRVGSDLASGTRIVNVASVASAGPDGTVIAGSAISAGVVTAGSSDTSPPVVTPPGGEQDSGEQDSEGAAPGERGAAAAALPQTGAPPLTVIVLVALMALAAGGAIRSFSRFEAAAPDAR